LSYREVEGVYRQHWGASLFPLNVGTLVKMHFSCVRLITVPSKRPSSTQESNMKAESWYFREWPEELRAAIMHTIPDRPECRNAQRAIIPAFTHQRLAVWVKTLNHGYFLVLLRRAGRALIACYMISMPTKQSQSWEPSESLWDRCVSSTSSCPLSSYAHTKNSGARPQRCLRAEVRFSERNFSRQLTLSMHIVQLPFIGDGLSTDHPLQGLALGYKHYDTPSFWLEHQLGRSQDSDISPEVLVSNHLDWARKHLPYLLALKQWRRGAHITAGDSESADRQFNDPKDAYLGDYYLVKDIIEGGQRDGAGYLLNQLANAEWLQILCSRGSTAPAIDQSSPLGLPPPLPDISSRIQSAGAVSQRSTATGNPYLRQREHARTGRIDVPTVEMP
jgi:hypothetical protein